MTTDKNKKTPIRSPDYEYRGYSTEEYERIFAFKQDGTVPTFEELEESKHKGKRSTFKHKCADFYISPDGTSLMYCKMNKTESKRMANESYHYLIVAVDHLTKWPEAQPIKRKTAANILTFFEGLCMRFGYPKVLITNQGREFCNKDMDKFCTDNCIDHQHPTTSAMVNQGISLQAAVWLRCTLSPLDSELDNLNQVPSDDIDPTEQAEEDRLQAFLDGVEERYKQLQND
uniref:Integrase catalytic domain-containing protein n=1 Tax=Plectus sambesii TaxID=2011161 RepID=A0A914W5G1_9BILA